MTPNEYFKEKYKDVPQVDEYIEIMTEAKVSARDIDHVLNIIAYEEDPLFIEAKLEPKTASKICKIYKRKGENNISRRHKHVPQIIGYINLLTGTKVSVKDIEDGMPLTKLIDASKLTNQQFYKTLARAKYSMSFENTSPAQNAIFKRHAKETGGIIMHPENPFWND